MTCEELKEKRLKLLKDIKNLKIQQFAEESGLPKGATFEEAMAFIQHKYGLTSAESRTSASNLDTVEGLAAQAEVEQNIGREAQQVVKDIGTGGLAKAIPGWRQKVHDFIVASAQAVKTNWSDGVRAISKQFVFEGSAFEIGKTASGKTVWAGGAVRAEIAGKVHEMFQLPEVTKGGWKFENFDAGMNMLGNLRNGDINQTASIIPDFIKALEAAKLKDPSLVQKGIDTTIKEAKLALDVSKIGAVKDYLGEYFERLDADAERMTADGVIKEKLDNYFHHVVAVEHAAGALEKMLNIGGFSLSSPVEARKYKDAREFYLAGNRGVSSSFIDNAVHYNKSLANSLRRAHMLKTLQSAQFDPEHFYVNTNADKDPLVAKIGKDDKGERFKTADQRDYQDMGVINAKFDGLYVHPEFFEWASNAMGPTWRPKGFIKTAMDANQLFKNVILSFGYGQFSVHGMSLTRKAGYLGQAIGAGNPLSIWFRSRSIMAQGNAMIRNYDEIFLKLLKGGMTVGQRDSIPMEATLEKFTKEGELTLGSKLGKAVLEYQKWSHSKLFEEFQPGMKAGMGKLAVESKWFQEMVKTKGEDVAYETLATQINNTFGGQNYELMGRNRGVQTLLRTTLLASDWQESKWRRMFGSVLAEQPEARRAYLYAIGTEMAMVIAAQFGLQKLASAITGNDRTMDQTIDDILKGKVGTLFLGMSKDGKKESRARMVFSEIEDMRPAIELANAQIEHYKKQEAGAMGVLQGINPITPGLKTVGKEIIAKTSPFVKAIATGMEEWPIPIAVEQAGKMAFGGGMAKNQEQRMLEAGAALAATFAGASIESRKSEKKTDGTKKEKKKSKLELFK